MLDRKFFERKWETEDRVKFGRHVCTDALTEKMVSNELGFQEICRNL